MPRTLKPGSKGTADQDDAGTNSSDSDLATTPTTHVTIPQWLIPEKLTPKFFSIQLPAIPLETERAIRASLKKKNSDVLTKESTRMINQISQLQHEEKQALHKVKVHKEKLAQALATKTEEIDALQKSNENETKKALESLEKNMRRDQEKQYEQMREKIKAEIRVEYEQKFAEERDKKRKRDEEKEKEEEKEEGEEDENPPKRQKLDASGDGMAKKDNHENDATPKEKSKLEELESKRVEVQKKMENLSEKKSEMFWLLKQVIMQEAKQKMERAKQQKMEQAKAGA